MKAKNKTLDLDAFGEIMDNFIKENEINMLITFPAGSTEVQVEDNVHAGGVLQFYIVLNAISGIVKTMKEDMERGGLALDEDKWGDVVETLLGLLRADLMGLN